jgi:L-ribulose-5-phosphate 4-epimerase
MFKDLKERVWRANLDLVRHGLVVLTFGNASGVDRERGVLAIKPSGLDYDALKPADIVIVDFQGRVVEGKLKPSSDTPTHIELYRAFPRIGGVVHAHSFHATMFAQAGRAIPCLGTTHADYFKGPVPVTRPVSAGEAGGDYEAATGRLIVARFRRLDPAEAPGVLVAGHGPFAWGASVEDAVRHALVLETVARTAWGTMALTGGRAKTLPAYLIRRHFGRKHGPDAYYGQAKATSKETPS